jgi:hypothetical protein
VAQPDLNGDGNPDLVVTNFDSANKSVLIGNGDGTIQPAVPGNASEAGRSLVSFMEDVRSQTVSRDDASSSKGATCPKSRLVVSPVETVANWPLEEPWFVGLPGQAGAV